MPVPAAAATTTILPGLLFTEWGNRFLSLLASLFFGGIDWWFWLAIPGFGLGMGALLTSSALPLALAALTVWCMKSGRRWIWPALITLVVSIVFLGYLMPLTLEFARLLPDYQNGREEHNLRCFGDVRDSGLDAACDNLKRLIRSPLFLTAHQNTWQAITSTWSVLIDRFYSLGNLASAAALIMGLVMLIRSLQQYGDRHGYQDDARTWIALLKQQQQQKEEKIHDE